MPLITDDLQILGPGKDVISVSGANAHRVFEIDSGVEVAISGLTVTSGLADTSAIGVGGGIWNLGTLTLADSLVTGNQAEHSGGGVANDGVLMLVRSTVSNNSAPSENFGVGGGIDNFAGTVVIIESTVSGNSTEFGGGISNTGSLTVLNSTISGNDSSSDFGSGGGGIDNFGGNVDFTFVTDTGNSADDGAGILNEDGQVTVKNSLIADNPNGDECTAAGTVSFTSLGANLDSDGTCPGFDTYTPAEIALGPLADHGGATLTHALGVGSAALDAATDCTEFDDTTVETDQRGVTRPQGQACDIGPFELVLVDDSDVIFADRFEGN